MTAHPNDSSISVGVIGIGHVATITWAEFRDLDFHELGKHMAAKNLVDDRNLLDGAAATAAGFTYRAMGRPEFRRSGS